MASSFLQRLRSQKQVVFDQRTEGLLLNELDRYSTQELAGVVTLMKRNGYIPSTNFVDKWIGRCLTRLRGFSSRDFVTVLYYLSNFRCQTRYEKFVEGWIKVSIRSISKFDAQGLSNSIYALSTLEITVPESFMDKWFITSERKLCHFNAQNLSNSIRALAKMEITVPKSFMDQWFIACGLKLRHFKPQELSNSIHALGKMEIILPKRVMHQWFIACEEKLRDFNPQELSISIYALSNLEITVPESFMDKWFIASKKTLPRFDPQGLSNSIYALSNLKITVPGSFMRKWFCESERRLPEFNPQNLSNSIYALSNLEITVPGSFMRKWFCESERRLPEFNPRNLSNSIYALSNLEITVPESFMDKWFLASEQKLQEFNLQALLNSVYSFLLLEVEIPETMIQRLSTIIRDDDFIQTKETVSQVLMIDQFVNLSLSKELLSRLYSTYRSIDEVISSRLQKNVCTHLSDLGLSIQEEQYLPEVPFIPVDILVSGKKIVIQVDGPCHFTRKNMRKTRLNTRILEKHGYTVYRISHKEWDFCENKDEFLRENIIKHL